MVPNLLVARILTVIVGLGVTVLGWTSPVWADDCQDPSTACYLFRQAYESRYTWKEPFPGFQAEVSFMVEQEQYHGLVRVDPNFTITVLNVEDPELKDLVEDQLANEITHRRRIPFEELHRDSTFEFINLNSAITDNLPDNYSVVGIKETTPESESSYLIVNGEKLTQVNRLLQPANLAVSVTTLAWLDAPQGHLPTWYKTVFRDPKTDEIVEVDDVRDTYQHMGSYWFLTKRQFRFGSESGPKQKPLPDMWFEFTSFYPV